MVAVRKGAPVRRGATDPHLLINRTLATIDRMAEAMWQDEAMRETGRPQPIKWEDESEAVRDKWRRSASAAFLAMLE